MQIESLKIFCDVVRLRSFSLCARENHVTQSSASQVVHSLEERLDVPLIDRTQRPWKLTAAGEKFYRGCRELLDRYEALEDDVKLTHRESHRVIRVSSIYSVGLGLMRDFVHRFSSQYPEVDVELEYHHPNKVYESVIDEETDLGIVSFPQVRRELSLIPWREEEMVVACSPTHPFSHKKGVDPKDLQGEKYVDFDRNLVIRREIHRYLKKHNTTVDVALEFDNIESIKRAVEVASGVSILPRPTLDRELSTGTLRAIPFITKDFRRPLGIIYRRGRGLNENAQRFVDLLRSEKETALSVMSVS